MAQRDGNGLLGYGMSGCGAEVGSSEVLVEVCPTNANKGRGDLSMLEANKRGYVPDLDAHLDLTRPDCRLGDILNPDVFLAVISGCSHCAVIVEWCL